MISKKLLTITALSFVFASCGKLHDLLETPAKLDKMLATMNGMSDTTGSMNKGMDTTNEAIRKQKLAIALEELQKTENRNHFTKMLPPGKTLAEALTAEEAVLFTKNYMTKINHEQFVDRHPGVDSETNPELLKSFENEKQNDIVMLKIVGGYLPEATLNQIMQKEAEQGAYREELFQILMFRAQFYDDTMLEGVVFKNALDTLGRIEKAMEYASKIKAVEQLPYKEMIAVKITGFKSDEKNENNSAVLDGKRSGKNYKKILKKAEKDFKAVSFAGGEQNATEIQKQNQRFEQLKAEIQKEIDAAK